MHTCLISLVMILTQDLAPEILSSPKCGDEKCEAFKGASCEMPHFTMTTRQIFKGIYFSIHIFRIIFALESYPVLHFCLFGGDDWNVQAPYQNSLDICPLWTEKLYSSCLLARFSLQIEPFLPYCLLDYTVEHCCFGLAVAATATSILQTNCYSTFAPCGEQSFTLTGSLPSRFVLQWWPVFVIYQKGVKRNLQRKFQQYVKYVKTRSTLRFMRRDSF